jgi:protein-S-isoprenylcysteine O-methyltransferase Ste14
MRKNAKYAIVGTGLVVFGILEWLYSLLTPSVPTPDAIGWAAVVLGTILWIMASRNAKLYG